MDERVGLLARQALLVVNPAPRDRDGADTRGARGLNVEGRVADVGRVGCVGSEPQTSQSRPLTV